MDSTTLLIISALLIGILVAGFFLLIPKPEVNQPDTSSAIKTMEDINKTISTATSPGTAQEQVQPPQATQPSQSSQPSSQPQQSQASVQISPVQPPAQLSNAYIEVFGEGYGKTELEAEEMAKNNGLQKLIEQLYVEVKSSAVLKEKLTTMIQDGKVKEKFETQYEKTIQTKSEMELLGVSYRTTERKKVGNQYYAKVQVYIEAEKAKQQLEAFLAIRLGKSLLDSKMIFSAKAIADKYEPLLSANTFPPKTAEELIQIVNDIRRRYDRVQNLTASINSARVTDKKSALEVANYLNELFSMVNDLPPGSVDVDKLTPFLNDVKISIKGPQDVLLGEQVKLEIFVEPTQVKSLWVFGEQVEAQDLVTLSDGNAVLSVLVKSSTSKVTVSLAGMVNATWAPGSVRVNPDILKTVYKTDAELKILAGGTAKIISDQKLMRENALKDALVKTMKKAASELLIGSERELLDVPLDEYILTKVIGAIDYEISATGEYAGLYYVLVSSKIKKYDFENYIKEALKNAPVGFALVLTEGDKLGYIEPAIIDGLLSSGIKLVSKDFSRKILEAQVKSNLPPTVLAKVTALSAARYLIYVIVNSAATYLPDYKVYSVRTLITTQIIDTITGNILDTLRFEEVNTGATEQAALSKTTSGQKFKEYVDAVASSLRFENAQPIAVYKYTFVLERVIYGSILLDYLNANYDKVRVVEKTDTKLIVEIENVPMADMEKFLSTVDALKIKKISDFNYQVTK
uniref:LPP20 lipoprotein n=1 Tax=Fervidobacterium pennivorans TaxID=93466 RepID=A0A7V4KC48_FERPE